MCGHDRRTVIYHPRRSTIQAHQLYEESTLFLRPYILPKKSFAPGDRLVCLPTGISRSRVWTTQCKKRALVAVQGKVQHG